MSRLSDRTARRTASVRRKVKRAAANGRARLSVFRSSKHIYAQLIDDEKGETVGRGVVARKIAAPRRKTKGADIEAAKAVGKLIAERAHAKGHQGRRVRPRRLSSITAASRRWPMPPARAVSTF